MKRFIFILALIYLFKEDFTSLQLVSRCMLLGITAFKAGENFFPELQARTFPLFMSLHAKGSAKATPTAFGY